MAAIRLIMQLIMLMVVIFVILSFFSPTLDKIVLAIKRTYINDKGMILPPSAAPHDAISENKDESTAPASIPSSQPSSSSSVYSCRSCSKEFQEKWGKCPSCGGEMKKAESPAPEPTPSAPMPASSNSNVGDPLDDLLGDFGSTNDTKDDSEHDSSEELPNNIRNVSDDDGGPSTDFGAQRSSHSNRKKVRKVRKVKRPRNP